MITARAVHAALRWIDERILLQASLANLLSDVLFFWKRLARGFVFDEFHAEKQSETAYIADVRMRLKRRQRGAEVFPCGTNALKKFVGFEIVKNSVTRRRRNRMCLIREAVHECAGAAFECFNHTRGNEYRAERRVAAGDSFPDENDVRFDAPVLTSEWFSCAAHAAHNFVGNQENSILAADFRDASGVSLRRHSGTESRANNRLKNKSGGFPRFVLQKMEFEIIGAGDFALRKSFFERAVVAKTRSDVSPFSNERFVGRAARHISADRQSTKRAAVIALPARKNAVPILLAAFEVK